MEKKFNLNNILFKIKYPIELDRFIRFFSRESTDSQEIKSTIDSSIYIRQRPNVKILEKISNAMYRTDKGVLLHVGPFLKVLIQFLDHHNITSKLYINISSSFRHRMKKILLMQTMEQLHHIYIQSLRHSMLFPYFALMNSLGCRLLHGGAFVVNDKATLILGFDGIGKSSILESARQAGYVPISDNFLLCDSNLVYSVPEPLRIGGSKRPDLHGKTFFQLPEIFEKVGIGNIVFTTLGNRYELRKTGAIRLQRLSEFFFDTLSEFNDFTKYITALSFLITDFYYEKMVYINPGISFYECTRAIMDDNLRLINDIVSL